MTMHWKLTLDGASIDESQITAGEWEYIFLLVNRLGLPHEEREIRPTHCPTCRNAIAVAVLVARGGVDEDVAMARIASVDRQVLVDAMEIVADTGDVPDTSTASDSVDDEFPAAAV